MEKKVYTRNLYIKKKIDLENDYIYFIKTEKMNYGKPNKEKFNEATKLIEQNTESKEEEMTEMFTYSLHEQLKVHIKHPEEWDNIFPVNNNFTLEEYEEMMDYISQGWLVQSDGWNNKGFIVNPDWDREPLWEPEEEEVETHLKWVPDKGLMNVGGEEEEEEECPTTIQYRKEIEEGCPEGHKTIWNEYGFKYEPLSEIEKWRHGQPSFNVDDKDALEKFEQLCRDSRDKWTFTKPEDLKVGDIVEETNYGNYHRLIQVSRLSDKSIWYRKAITRKYKWKDHMGNEYTFGIWLGEREVLSAEEEMGEFKEFRRKRDTKVRESAYEEGGESWRGEWVCDKSEMIWLKEYYNDIWR